MVCDHPLIVRALLLLLLLLLLLDFECPIVIKQPLFKSIGKCFLLDRHSLSVAHHLSCLVLPVPWITRHHHLMASVILVISQFNLMKILWLAGLQLLLLMLQDLTSSDSLILLYFIKVIIVFSSNHHLVFELLQRDTVLGGAALMDLCSVLLTLLMVV